MLKILLPIFIFSFAFSQEVSVQKEKLNLVVGIKKEISIDFDLGPSSLIYNASKVEIQQVPKLKQLILSGKAVGSSNIIIKDSFGKTRIEYDVTVTETSQSSCAWPCKTKEPSMQRS